MADLVEVANLFYRDEPGPHVVLTVDLARAGSPWRYDGDVRYPHVYGPLDRAAVVRVRAMVRDDAGSFVHPGPFVGAGGMRTPRPWASPSGSPTSRAPARRSTDPPPPPRASA